MQIMILYLLVVFSSAAKEDLIDIKQVPAFPQDYQGNLYAGYLSLPTKKLYYIFAER